MSTTEQVTFDIVKEHLLKQGKVAVAGCKCLYRTSDGLKCAVGCLIPDDLYVAGMEDSGAVDGLLSEYPQLREVDAINHHDELLKQLQWVHDCHRVEEWPERLQEVATNFGLEYV